MSQNVLLGQHGTSALAVWMPAIVASIGAVVTLYTQARSSREKREAELRAKELEREKVEAEKGRTDLEREKSLVESALATYRGHVADLMSDNRRLREALDGCERHRFDCQEQQRVLREENYLLSLRVEEQQRMIQRLEEGQ